MSDFSEAYALVDLTTALEDSQAEVKRLQESQAEVKRLQGELDVARLQSEGLKEMQKGFDSMKTEADIIALHLRSYFNTEIERGYHAGRPLGEIVGGYLKELKGIPRWVRFLCSPF